jgi:hypothetical protein
MTWQPVVAALAGVAVGLAFMPLVWHLFDKHRDRH